MSSALLIVGIASVGAGLYESSQQQGIENQALGLAQSTAGKQNYYNSQLEALMNNPSSFLSSNIFQSSLDQGLLGVQRSMAAGGFGGSGNMAGGLEQYGQSQALGALFSQEQILGSLSGAETASSPTQALATASGAQTASSNELAATMYGLGYGNTSGSGLLSMIAGNGGGGDAAYINAATAFQGGTQGAGSAFAGNQGG